MSSARGNASVARGTKRSAPATAPRADRTFGVNRMLAAKAFLETPAAELTPQAEREFFGSLMTRNKTYKTTFHHRFAGINPLLLQQLKQDGFQSPDVLDIGVSSGISTVELHDDLCEGGVHARIVATDLLVDALLVRVLPKCHALVEPDAFPLRFDLPFVTMKPWVTQHDYRNGFCVLRKAINIVMTQLSRRILRDPDDPKIRRVKLVTPRLLATDNIVVCSDDISRYNEAFTNRFDFIRAANVLNKGYFPAAVLSTMLANVARYLRGPGAILFVVRTHEDDSNHGTLFRMEDDGRFRVVWRVGTGSEIEETVLQSALPVQ